MIYKNAQWVYDLAHRYGGYIPLSRLNTVYRNIDQQSMNILDVGCGSGLPMKYLNRKKKYETTGIDISAAVIEQAKNSQSHTRYLVGNVMSLDIPARSFDTVICLEMIEHLTKTDGYKLIERLETIAKRQVIFSTPVGFLEAEGDTQPGSSHDSGWDIHEFVALGYRIRGNLLRIERPIGKFVYKRLKPVVPLYLVMALGANSLVAPLPYYYPARFAQDMVCVKNLV